MNAQTHPPVRLKASSLGLSPEAINNKALKILAALQGAGYEAYLVGGCVRDLLLGATPKDFDIATSAHPEEIKEVLPSTRIIGRRFRLAHVHFGREYYEVATFRAPHNDTDNCKVGDNGRILHDNVYGTIAEDAVRRDFAINALFYDARGDEILDFVDGMADIEQRRLKLIGDPETRYREDPVRMLRAVRFAAKLGLEISAESCDPIADMAPLLKDIAPARLFDECLKMFHSGMGVRMLPLLREYGLFRYLFPMTESGLAAQDDPHFATLIESSLRNTDKRINSDMSVTPAFLYAVMLWEPLSRAVSSYQADGQPEIQAVQLASNDVMMEQVRHTAMPRRFSNVTREIWILQLRFEQKLFSRASKFLESRRFRAAFDFLCLRAEATQDEVLLQDAEWWETFQTVDTDTQVEMCRAVPNKKSNRRRKKRRKKRNGSKPA